MLSDVLALHDIPEVDSRRLSELCRILNALEGLFVDVENPDPEAVRDSVYSLPPMRLDSGYSCMFVIVILALNGP